MLKLEYKELSESFEAIDGNGKTYIVNIFDTIEEINKFYRIYKGKDYRIEDGSFIKKIDDSNYELRDGTRITKNNVVPKFKNSSKGSFKFQ
jgi:hypothetical protein